MCINVVINCIICHLAVLVCFCVISIVYCEGGTFRDRYYGE